MTTKDVRSDTKGFNIFGVTCLNIAKLNGMCYSIHLSNIAIPFDATVHNATHKII